MIRFLIIIVLTALFSCGPSSMRQAMETEPDQSAKPKTGAWISRRADGTIRTRIMYKNGLKHGMSHLYYDDGKSIQLELPYVAGARHGTSRKYYRDGALYAETAYESDLLHGERRTYYSNGTLKSTITYARGFPGNDLVEYLMDGSKKTDPGFTYSRNGKLLTVLPDEQNCKEARLFHGSLMPGDFFDEESDAIEEIFRTDDQFLIDLNVLSPSYLSLQDLICHCKSSQGNPRVIRTRVEL